METGTRGHTCALRTTLARVFWEDTRQPVERGSECRATHTYTLATALTPLPRWRGLPRESPHVYSVRTNTRLPIWYYDGTRVPVVVRTYVRTRVPCFGTSRTMVHVYVPWYVLLYPVAYTCVYYPDAIRSFSPLAAVSPPKTHVVLSAHVVLRPFPIRKL